MEHRLGGMDLIRWQDRRGRRPKPGVAPWTVILALCALVGCSTLTAQVFGFLSWSGPMAAVPAVLVLVAVCAQAVTVARAAIAWLIG